MAQGSQAGSSAAPSKRTHGELVLSLHANVLDIGLAGLAIETETRLTPQHSLAMRIGSSSHELELSGHVVWCFFHGTTAAATGEQLPVYRAGIEFSDVLTPRATDLLRFLEAHAVVTMETRLFGRFRLDEAGPVSVHSHAPFRLRSVRGDGVEIEASLGVEPAAGAQAALHLQGVPESVLVTLAELARTADGEDWRLFLRFSEPQPALVERARALLSSS